VHNLPNTPESRELTPSRGSAVNGPNMNLRDLVILVADASSYMSMLIHSMLRGFGANKVIEVRDSIHVLQVLSAQRTDILICDSRLPSIGGLKLTRAIRGKVDNEHRTIPIMLMSSDSSESMIKRSRDAGANMVIAKPISPASLYDRLTWVAFNSRKFVDTETYFGPDRRFKIERYPGGVDRRKGDKAFEVGEESRPTLAQGDIDSQFSAVRTGQK
jgi:two-component system, chemotaxis family, chemotaxis protein CheY